MSDVHTKVIRSKNMAAIKGKNTKPELKIAEALRKRKIHFRSHDSSLPGKPDFVIPEYGAVIFMHGCFWHQHNCHLFKWPSTRPEFWKTKLDRNVVVDHRNERQLKQQGWWILKIWECALKGKKRMDFDLLMERVEHWLKYEERNKSIIGK